MITEMEEVAYLNDLADRLGMDTITVGNLCALVMEARAKGRIDYAIDYGNADQLAALITKIAAREGIGNILADGIIAASGHFGLTDLAIHVKGMEPAGYEPRVLKGMGLTFGTSPRGACHLRTTFYKPELSGMIPPDQIEDKAALLIEFENRLNIFDTLILCRFYRDLYTWPELEKAIALAIGVTGREELEAIAVRVTDMTRLYNLREGLTAADDRLPARLHREKLPDGRSLTADEMEYLLQDYYRLRGWNTAGVPASR
jgi:aldehyde:ferredoxin oxidoreductase